MKLGVLGFVLLVSFFVFFSLVLCSFYLFNYLVVLEKFKVLMLITVLMIGGEETRVLFMSMMAMFVLNISVMLIIVGLRICGDSLRVVTGY